jgi:hypothetical protein
MVLKLGAYEDMAVLARSIHRVCSRTKCIERRSRMLARLGRLLNIVVYIVQKKNTLLPLKRHAEKSHSTMQTDQQTY